MLFLDWRDIDEENSSAHMLHYFHLSCFPGELNSFQTSKATPSLSRHRLWLWGRSLLLVTSPLAFQILPFCSGTPHKYLTLKNSWQSIVVQHLVMGKPQKNPENNLPGLLWPTSLESCTIHRPQLTIIHQCSKEWRPAQDHHLGHDLFKPGHKRRNYETLQVCERHMCPPMSVLRCEGDGRLFESKAAHIVEK